MSGTLVKSQTMAVAYGIDEECNVSDDHFGPLLRGGQGGTRQAVAFNIYGGNKRADRPEGGFYVKEEDTTKTLDSATGLNPTCAQGGVAAVSPAPTLSMQVRRLTPTECERLQGFPDGYTDIKPKGKPTADGPRYKALGNSMAVPVMAWIGMRIQQVEDLK